MENQIAPDSYFTLLEPYKHEDITVELERDPEYGNNITIRPRMFERRVSYWKPRSLMIDQNYLHYLQDMGFVHHVELGYYKDESYMPDRLKGICAPILITVITRFKQ